jgi:undecaprenyl-diphosphatase
MKKAPKITKKYTKINPTAQLLIALGLFIIAVLASQGEEITAWEINLLLTIYSWPSFLQPVFMVITQMGAIYMLGILLAIYMIKRHYHIVLRLLLTGTLAYLSTGVAKDIWGRVRPYEYLVDVTSLEYLVRGPGFPSGHMALATALAFTLAYHLPKSYRWLLAAGVVGVGLSRLYLGVHAPLDIVGGFAIGWASYALFRHVRLMALFTKKRHKTA